MAARVSDGGEGAAGTWWSGAPRELFLSEHLSGALLAEACGAGSTETCGLLVGRREVVRSLVARTVACRNAAPVGMTETRFEIDPRRLIEEERAARTSGEEVVGFYHSHPAGDPVPSPVDRVYMALWPGMVWVIVGAGVSGMQGRVRAWSFDPEREVVPREVRIESASGGQRAVWLPNKRDT